MSIDFSQEESQTPLMTSALLGEDEGEGSLRPKRLSEYIGQESNSFLERYYDGDITAMLSAYIENDRLSETEIDTLRSLLSKRSKKGGN